MSMMEKCTVLESVQRDYLRFLILFLQLCVFSIFRDYLSDGEQSIRTQISHSNVEVLSYPVKLMKDSDIRTLNFQCFPVNKIFFGNIHNRNLKKHTAMVDCPTHC